MSIETSPNIQTGDDRDPRLEPETVDELTEDPHRDPFLTGVLKLAKRFELDETKLYNRGTVEPTTRSRLQHLWNVTKLKPANYDELVRRFNNCLGKSREKIKFSEFFEPLYIAEKTVLTERSEPYQRALATAIRLQALDERQEEGMLGAHRRDELYTLLVFSIDPDAFRNTYETRIQKLLQVRKAAARLASSVC